MSKANRVVLVAPILGKQFLPGNYSESEEMTTELLTSLFKQRAKLPPALRAKVEAELERRLDAIVGDENKPGSAKDPRAVFKLGAAEKRGPKVAPLRDQFIAMEALRLIEIEGVIEEEAIRLVLAKYSEPQEDDPGQTIENALKRWRKVFKGEDTSIWSWPDCVRLYDEATRWERYPSS